MPGLFFAATYPCLSVAVRIGSAALPPCPVKSNIVTLVFLSAAAQE